MVVIYCLILLAMRFNLADAGDSIEDANFVEKHANATILRLHGLVDWTKVRNLSSGSI